MDMRTGWIPDVPDDRDYTLKGLPGVLQGCDLARCAHDPASSQVPSKIDLRKFASPIENQGGLDSCSAHCAVAMLEYFERRGLGTHTDASRLFVYKCARDLAGKRGDVGSDLRTTMKALEVFGAPPETLWPYDSDQLDATPSVACYHAARGRRTLTYFRLDYETRPFSEVLHEAKLLLAHKFPVAFGLPVHAEYLKADRTTGHIAYPSESSRFITGHANVAFGYDDNVMGGQGALLVRNSWGRNWGAEGYGWLPYSYVLNGLTLDWWSITKTEWMTRSDIGDAPN